MLTELQLEENIEGKMRVACRTEADENGSNKYLLVAYRCLPRFSRHLPGIKSCKQSVSRQFLTHYNLFTNLLAKLISNALVTTCYSCL